MSENTIAGRMRTIITDAITSDSPRILENSFSQYIGRESLFTFSGRTALYAAFKNIEVKGEVITTPLVCVAALFHLLRCQLRPHFVDVDPETFNIDPDKINEAVSRKTVGLQVIHLAGNPCDMKAICEICEDHDLILIEDCAQAFGAEYKGQKVGAFGKISCFSFSKPPMSCRGGMVCSNQKSIIETMRRDQEMYPKPSLPVLVRDYGGYIPMRGILGRLLKTPAPNSYEDFFNTFLFRPNRIIANFALHKLKKALSENLVCEYSDIGKALTEELRRCSVEVQKQTPYSKRVFTRCMILVDDSYRAILELRKRGIEAVHLSTETREGIQTRLDRHPNFSRFDSVKKCKRYLEIHDHIVSLPISLNPDKRKLVQLAEHIGHMLKK